MFLLIVMLTISGLVSGCDIGQVCYKCRGNIYTCNNGYYFYTTADDCISYVMDSTTKLSAHYKPSNTKCFPYTCTNNLYFQDSTRFVIRKTCNSDCTNFTLTEYQSNAISAIAYSSAVKSLGQCFEDCFDTAGCYAFSYGYSVCSLYTSCGTSCALYYSYGTTVYTRTCHEETDCDDPDDIDNGEVDTPDGTTENNVALYTCSDGYSLVGSSSRTCQSDEEWSGSAPVCSPVDCGSLTSPSNGNIYTSSGTTYSNQADYSCLSGYSLVGSSSRTCQSDGQWSGSAPVCNAVDCGLLSSPSNGDVNTTSGTMYSDQAEYTCSDGYTLVGSETRTCQSDGQWSGSAPVCNAVDCGLLSSPSNGDVNTTSGTMYSDQAEYSCSDGYTLVGSETRTCQSDGQWSGSAPVCNAVDCGLLSSPSNGDVNTTSGTMYSDQAHYTCSDGFSLVGSSSRTCQSDGQWSGSAPICNAVDCGLLASPSNGDVNTTSGTMYSDQADYTCSYGYTLVGSETRTCQSDGQWSGSAPVCNAVDCGLLSSPSNGDVNTTSETMYSDQADYTCYDGYTLVGSETRTCQSDGQWSGSAPVCNAVDCGLLSSPSNGDVNTTSGTMYSDQADYTCYDGYTLVGSETRTCQSDGQWSGSAPVCNAVDCGLLSPPSNGDVNTTSGTMYSDQAEYTCSDGYTLVGSETRTCQSDGQWSGSAPICNAVDCGLLASPSNGDVNTTSGTMYSDQADYTCSDGYTLVGSETRTCQSDGQWSGSAPVCSQVDCGSLMSPSNGTVNTTSGTMYSNQATYSCFSGFSLVGSGSRTCQSDGQWSGSAPVCNAVDCGLLSSPSNGDVNTTSGTMFSDQAHYTCSDGYSLVGSSTRTCQSDGQWSGSAPLCSSIDCGPLASPLDCVVNTSTGTLYSNQAVYSCSVGFMLIGNSTRMCQSNGLWSGSPPSCDSVDCGNLTSPANGYVQNPVATTYTELASYFCSTGYYILGPSERTCQSDGNWNGTSPTCQPMDCGIPASPGNCTVEVHNGTTYRTVAIFSCNTGYTLYGESEAVCNASGVWNSSNPACYIIDCGSTTAPVDGTVQYPAGTTYGGTATFQCDTGYYLSHLNNRTCQSNGVWSMTSPKCVANGTVVPGPSRLYIAPCICYPNKTFTGLTQDEIIQLLTESMRIEPNSTALAHNRLKCAEDPRMSSRIIGSAGAGIIATVFGLLISLDVFTLCQKLSHAKYLKS